jgi:dCMP deaminase
MVNQSKLDEAYMGCARSMAIMSHAIRKKVGAIIVSEDGIIGEGWNGTPAGFDNVCEDILPTAHDVRYALDSQMWHCAECNKLFASQEVIPGDSLGSSCTHIGVDRLITKPEVLHAESNAIAKVARSTNSSKKSTLYITCSPCFECSKSIIQAGIKRVVYEEEYRLLDGIDLLRRAGIEVEKHAVV